jgi:hypothetical protein
MLHGEYIRKDGLVIPNTITDAGARQILRAALQSEDWNPYIALGDCVPENDLTVDDSGEPPVTFGYARIPLARDDTDWPVVDDLNGITFIESKEVTFTAVGGNFTKVTRILLADDDVDGNILSVSGAFPDLIITPTTDESLRTWKYRIYLR